MIDLAIILLIAFSLLVPYHNLVPYRLVAQGNYMALNPRIAQPSGTYG